MVPSRHFLLSLTSVDISYNQLEGPVPGIKAFREAPFEALTNNKGLCGNLTALKACNTGGRKELSKLLLVLILSIPIFSAIGTYFLCRRLRNIKAKIREARTEEDLFALWSHDKEVSYEDIIQATEDFDSKYCIGTGGHGDVYKATILQTGRVFAVKRLRLTENNEMVDLKAFESEIQALAEIRHRNIVKFYGSCSSSKHSFLVYEFMERGSLGSILGNEEEVIQLDWRMRVNVFKGMAKALSYMHHGCSPPVIHRDISSNNVLLDFEYEAHISDFRTARLLNYDSSHWTSFAPTFGYTAPVGYALTGFVNPGNIIIFGFSNRVGT